MFRINLDANCQRAVRGFALPAAVVTDILSKKREINLPHRFLPRGCCCGESVQRGDNELNQGKTRASMFGVIGAYLLYTAYQFFKGRNDPNTTMTPVMMILFIVLLALAGIVFVFFAVRIWKQSAKEKEEPTEDDRKSLK